MRQKKTVTQALTAQEIHLLEQLRQHPEIQERVQSLLEIVGNKEGPLKTADEVEDLVGQELRRLGSATLHQWANRAEERVSTELRQQDRTVLSRKKNAEVVVCLRADPGERADLVQPYPKLPASVAQASGG